MRTLAEDTHREAERVLIQLLRRATPARKLAKLRRRLADLWLGPELAAKAYGPPPDHD